MFCKWCHLPFAPAAKGITVQALEYLFGVLAGHAAAPGRAAQSNYEAAAALLAHRRRIFTFEDF